MVITTSDSTNTLVSLDRFPQDGLKGRPAVENSVPTSFGMLELEPSKAFRRTVLILPSSDDENDYDETDSSDCTSSEDDESTVCCSVDSSPSSSLPRPNASASTFLHLPEADSDQSVDECLMRVPALWDARDDLLVQTPIQLNDGHSMSRTLYVSQGELAHCSPSQTDVLVSDRATTCHILALRSTCDTNSSNKSTPLCTMAHIDGTGYSSCLRAAFQAHQDHHGNGVDLDIHVVGGFVDSHGSSRDISTWLLHELASLAEEYVDSMRCTLQTVCISSMNHNGMSDSPMLRGLAMHCSTGRVFVPSTCNVGPAASLRAARLWSTSEGHRRLYVIHTATTDEIVLAPFSYEICDSVMSLLEWSDDELLQSCSTSPHCEEDDFCDMLRSTLRFMASTPSSNAFANTSCRRRRKQPQPLRFRRSQHHANEWERC